MLSSQALTELLSRNSDGRLCKRWFIMTPNGTLLAYTKPTDIRDLRRQAAIAAMSWQEHSEDHASTYSPGGDEPRQPDVDMLHTLTMENEHSNLIVRKIQPRLLLVLEGGVPPKKKTFEQRITPEGPGDTSYPSLNEGTTDSVPGSSASSIAESTTKPSVSRKTLALQRRKLDALASAMALNLEKTGFRMPDTEDPEMF